MAQGQSYFTEDMEDPTLQDSLFVRALEGDGQNPGFIEIINSYGGSASAEIATYNAGMIYLQRGEYDLSIDYLEDFSANDPILGALALGGIADAFTELNQLEDALGYYKKAANYADNDLTTPREVVQQLSKHRFDGRDLLFDNAPHGALFGQYGVDLVAVARHQ